MSKELIEALTELEKERGIPKNTLIEAIKSALNTAYKKNGTSQNNMSNVSVELDEKHGIFTVIAAKRVVEKVDNPFAQISLDKAKEIQPDVQLDDMIEVEVTPANFCRIAAQTAKQVVVQKLREVERGMVYEEYAEMEGEIITGTIHRVEPKKVVVDLGKTEGVMLANDMVPGEEYEVGQRIKGYIYEVKNNCKGPSILMSRSHAYFLRRLFELEVHEIYSGAVEIVSIAREAGSRSKISVRSRDENVDPVGACVGQRGIRVQNIVSELNGEKVDIIKYDKDPRIFIGNALSPSRVTSVIIDDNEKIARVVVPDQHLSLAIGKEGQNVRLAARLTGWKIDIKSESQMLEAQEEQEV